MKQDRAAERARGLRLLIILSSRTVGSALGLLCMLPLLRRFGKAALAVELSAVAGLYYVFRSINSGGPESRRWWDDRAPWLIDAFHKATGDDRVIEHRVTSSKEK